MAKLCRYFLGLLRHKTVLVSVGRAILTAFCHSSNTDIFAQLRFLLAQFLGGHKEWTGQMDRHNLGIDIVVDAYTYLIVSGC